MDAYVRNLLSDNKGKWKLTTRDIVFLELHNHTLYRKWDQDKPFNQNRVIGLIGETGSSKSIGAATIAFVDYMLMRQNCYSNLDIVHDIVLPEALIELYELISGSDIERVPAHYESVPLDIKKMLKFNPEYMDGVVVIDEINIALADAWRTMSNQALASADYLQQLRKMHCAMIHTCLDEMFIPNRIRDGTDLFIRCRDLAYYSQYQHQNHGVTFEWLEYPMTGKFFNYDNMYSELGTYYERVLFHGRKSWGLVDSEERQHRKKYVATAYDQDAEEIVDKYGIVPDEVKPTEALQGAKDKYGWLQETNVIRELYNGIEKERYELLDALAKEIPEGVKEFNEDDILAHIQHIENMRTRWSGGNKYFKLGSIRERELTTLIPII